MKYRVFATESEAIAAEQQISQDLGYSKTGVNAATGKIEPTILTTRWAIPQHIQDGRWVFPSPDEEGVEASDDWWPALQEYIQ